MPWSFPCSLLYARDQIRQQVMTPGQFFTFLYAMFNAYMPLKRIGSVYQQFQSAQGASTQVFAYLDLPEEVPDAPWRTTVLRPFQREIEFKNVSFAYDSAPIVARSILSALPAAKCIALVGSSGAGKTTLVNLLPRFYDATSGTIRYRWRRCPRRSRCARLREQIAMVTQENILFHDTVWNNICYGLVDVPEEKVIAAAQAALAHDFILELAGRLRYRDR